VCGAVGVRTHGGGVGVVVWCGVPTILCDMRATSYGLFCMTALVIRGPIAGLFVSLLVCVHACEGPLAHSLVCTGRSSVSFGMGVLEFPAWWSAVNAKAGHLIAVRVSRLRGTGPRHMSDDPDMAADVAAAPEKVEGGKAWSKWACSAFATWRAS
jgi:hypothetical protein